MTTKIDEKSALDRLGGDRDLLHKLQQVFIETIEDTLKSLESSLNGRDFDAAARFAHSIGSSAATLGATTLSAQAKSLYSKIKADNLAELEAELPLIRSELAEVLKQLKG